MAKVVKYEDDRPYYREVDSHTALQLRSTARGTSNLVKWGVVDDPVSGRLYILFLKKDGARCEAVDIN